jgi:RHS repeat-associated core domain protein
LESECHNKKLSTAETAGHIRDAIKKGCPDIVTLQRSGSANKKKVKKRRRESLKGHKCQKGKDRDEWPMAMFKEGGKIITAQIMLQIFSTLAQVIIGERVHL